MKCLLFICTLCVVARFIDGDQKQSTEMDANRGQPIFRRETEDDSSNDKAPKNREELESNVEQSSSSKEEPNLPISSNLKDKNTKNLLEQSLKLFASEMAAADPADLMSHQHIKQASKYNNLGRRFVPQYKYTAPLSTEPSDHEENALVPEKAPPELVLVIAKESTLLAPQESEDPDGYIDRKQILRTGEYWNGVWKDEVDPKTVLRSEKNKVLGSIKAKIKPGSEFYQVVSRMQKISPRLLYIINKKQL